MRACPIAIDKFSFQDLLWRRRMTDNVKDLQQLAEAKGGATPLEWSTISNTHGGQALAVANTQSAALDTGAAINLIKQLQQLPQHGDASPLDWSTISNTHGGGGN